MPSFAAKTSPGLHWLVLIVLVGVCLLALLFVRGRPVATGPVPPPPLTSAQAAVLQHGLAPFVAQLSAATGIRLVPVPAGKFTMGAAPGTGPTGSRATNEGPLTQVTLTKDFFLGATLVTQGQYEALMDKNPSSLKKAGKDAPVENVSWDDAMAFCQKLTAREQTAGHLSAAYLITLPTEAQWEYACRAGATGPDRDDLATLAWFHDNSEGSTHPVAQKPPNAWGFYDLHGNVFEWCADLYVNHLPGGAVTDPTGPATGTARALRGGSWKFPLTAVRTTSRISYLPDFHGNAVGFRLALVPVAAK